MKKPLLSLLTISFIFLQGCFSINEEIYLHANNSGEYSIEMDLSQAMTMIQTITQSFADSLGIDDSDNADADMDLSENKDTIIYLKSYVDTSTTLSGEEKRILGKSRLIVNGNPQIGAFKMKLSVPFDNLNELQTLTLTNSNGGAFLLMFSALGTKNQNLPTDKNLNEAQSPYEILISGNSFERKFSEQVFNKIKKNLGEEMLDEEFPEMLENAGYNTTLHFDNPVKNISGPKAEISADRKTVTVNVSMKDFLKDPALLAYKVEF